MKARPPQGDYGVQHEDTVKPTTDATATPGAAQAPVMNSTPDEAVRTKADIQRELDTAQAELDAWNAAAKGPAPMRLTNHVYLLKKALQFAQK